ncbi:MULTISPECIES: hypothetical protein [unclassified Mesorhizobium]|uniref:hypothetical protein n=1 Tax=unclassified Mesorhizobium TaxID=325217 RepID=UPI000A7C10CF|nr:MULTISPECIES: hypothetical protein [unclassified Mesorhizobium]TGV90090.1 hypothetical protein EN801_020775 [Mesorhizobium sp. M00.F.Ca.ET.158.01.1.1]AZO61756.1 hypothetical protein EJ078_22685 [Mesorhizobium sp. M1A.F.Ca.IN.022.06.1.1]MCT2580560.1 hypothetical protein [Mesorhizobium sp. P13.3]MDF3169502.1 hypothetical protein [Mesorhizobium sp. P16.1]MDF3178836.1 hypothetical protein [Mesorhizobium sp. P17.1]
MANYLSPTGSPITGTLERLTGRAHISDIDPETGEPEYAGGTEIFWNDIQTAKRNGKIVFLDEEGDEWTFDQLTREDVDEEEEDACDGPDPRTAELQEIADGAFGDGPMARGAARDMLKREQR